jgi:hypothetical protein
MTELQTSFLMWCKKSGYKPDVDNASEMKPGMASIRYELPPFVDYMFVPMRAHVLARAKEGRYVHHFGVMYSDIDTLIDLLKG